MFLKQKTAAMKKMKKKLMTEGKIYKKRKFF